jgi:hypothetical protein
LLRRCILKSFAAEKSAMKKRSNPPQDKPDPKAVREAKEMVEEQRRSALASTGAAHRKFPKPDANKRAARSKKGA